MRFGPDTGYVRSANRLLSSLVALEGHGSCEPEEQTVSAEVEVLLSPLLLPGVVHSMLQLRHQPLEDLFLSFAHLWSCEHCLQTISETPGTNVKILFFVA